MVAHLTDSLHNNICALLATVHMLQHDDMYLKTEDAGIFQHHSLLLDNSIRDLILKNRT